MTDRDPLLDALAELPKHDVDDWRKENIRHEAHRRLGRAPPSPASIFYRRFVEPASVYGFGLVYLAWAFSRVATIYGG